MPKISLLQSSDPDVVERAKAEQESLQKLLNLFKGFKFFLNREVPRETLAFVIRCIAFLYKYSPVQPRKKLLCIMNCSSNEKHYYVHLVF
jgi:hypothetical protein